jgi:membrane protein implicated in regulation of membrane protease activity
MTALHYLFVWANAPYTIAAGVAMLFAVLQATGVLGLLAGGGDDTDADADADVDHDVDADADHDVDHDADGDHDQDHDADGRGIGAILLAPLGIGRIPFSLVWQAYAIVFAITGLALNAHTSTPPVLSLMWTLPISLAAGYVAVAALARLLGPMLSSQGQEATSRAELVGQTGVVISSRVSAEFGEVRVKDKTGHDLRVICKLAAGVREPKEHEQVVFVEYDDEKGLLVSPMDRIDLPPDGGGDDEQEQPSEPKGVRRAG